MRNLLEPKIYIGTFLFKTLDVGVPFLSAPFRKCLFPGLYFPAHGVAELWSVCVFVYVCVRARSYIYHYVFSTYQELATPAKHKQMRVMSKK